ncbi:MAG: hypothetical protein AB9891_02630 [Anaerolineaceae bacterium]
MKKNLVVKAFSLLLVFCLLSGCGGQPVPAQESHTAESQSIVGGSLPAGDKQALDDAARAVEAILANPPEPITIEETASEEPAAGEKTGIDTTPQETTVTTEDGVTLEATYYPSSSDPAPFLVVFYHWAGGDRHDFDETARWLQNLPNPAALGPVKVHLSLNHRDLPPLDPDLSVASFAATFRGCGPDGCKTGSPQGWLKDTLAIMEQAKKMPGIGPDTKIISMGSSIGADASAYACAKISGCSLVLPLSPGGYLGIPFETNLKTILTNKIQTTCIGEAKTACIPFETSFYTSIPQEKGHGNTFFDQGRLIMAEYFAESMNECSDGDLAIFIGALNEAKTRFEEKSEKAAQAQKEFSAYESVTSQVDGFIKQMEDMAGTDYENIDAQTAKKIAENFDAVESMIKDLGSAISEDENPNKPMKNYAEELNQAARNIEVVKEVYQKEPGRRRQAFDGMAWENRSGSLLDGEAF